MVYSTSPLFGISRFCRSAFWQFLHAVLKPTSLSRCNDMIMLIAIHFRQGLNGNPFLFLTVCTFYSYEGLPFRPCRKCIVMSMIMSLHRDRRLVSKRRAKTAKMWIGKSGTCWKAETWSTPTSFTTHVLILNRHFMQLLVFVIFLCWFHAVLSNVVCFCGVKMDDTINHSCQTLWSLTYYWQ